MFDTPTVFPLPTSLFLPQIALSLHVCVFVCVNLDFTCERKQYLFLCIAYFVKYDVQFIKFPADDMHSSPQSPLKQADL